MAEEQLAPNANIEEVSSKLNEGLKTCRDMVSKYREFLSSDSAIDPIAQADDNPEGGAAPSGRPA